MNLSTLHIPTAWARARHYSQEVAPYVSDKDAALATYADGGYPLYYQVDTTSEYHGTSSEAMCPVCASSLHEHGEPTARVVAADVNWEDPDFYCDCGARIPSAYAEPEDA